MYQVSVLYFLLLLVVLILLIVEKVMRTELHTLAASGLAVRDVGKDLSNFVTS